MCVVHITGGEGLGYNTGELNHESMMSESTHRVMYAGSPHATSRLIGSCITTDLSLQCPRTASSLTSVCPRCAWNNDETGMQVASCTRTLNGVGGGAPACLSLVGILGLGEGETASRKVSLPCSRPATILYPLPLCLISWLW